MAELADSYSADTLRQVVADNGAINAEMNTLMPLMYAAAVAGLSTKTYAVADATMRNAVKARLVALEYAVEEDGSNLIINWPPDEE